MNDPLHRLTDRARRERERARIHGAQAGERLWRHGTEGDAVLLVRGKDGKLHVKEFRRDSLD